MIIYSLRLDDQQKQEYDRKYRGEELLKYETSVVVDKQGRILSLEWSKP